MVILALSPRPDGNCQTHWCSHYNLPRESINGHIACLSPAWMELTAEDAENHRGGCNSVLYVLCRDPLTAPLAPRHSPDNDGVNADPD